VVCIGAFSVRECRPLIAKHNSPAGIVKECDLPRCISKRQSQDTNPDTSARQVYVVIHVFVLVSGLLEKLCNSYTVRICLVHTLYNRGCRRRLQSALIGDASGQGFLPSL
jgi:hypothetical protein